VVSNDERALDHCLSTAYNGPIMAARRADQ